MTLKVYESQGGRAFDIYIDDWGNVFTRPTRDQVKNLTWQGIPISQQRTRLQGPSILGNTDPIYPPTSSSVPKHVDFETPPSPYNHVERTSSMENLCGSMSHISLGDTARNFQGGPLPQAILLQG